MDFKDISCVIAIYEHKNITKAAESLYITQSALSQQLQKIETRLGKPLFIRSNHTITPTPAGRIVIEHGQKLLTERNMLLYAVEHMSDMPEEQITIGLSPFYSRHLLPGIVERFQKDYPQYVLRYFDNGTAHSLEKSVADGKLDCCVVPMIPLNSDVEYWPIGTEEFFLAVPHNHPINQLSLPDKTLDLALTKDEPYIMHQEHSKVYFLYDKVFQVAGFKPHVKYTAVGWDTILSFVNKGMGLTLISELITNDYPPDNTPCFYRIHNTDASRLFAFGYRRGRIPTPAMLTLLEVVKEEFALQKQQVRI